MRDESLVLGMETSCDEIGVGIARGHTLPAGALLAGVAALGSHLVAAGARPSKLDFAADSAMPLKLVGV